MPAVMPLVLTSVLGVILSVLASLPYTVLLYPSLCTFVIFRALLSSIAISYITSLWVMLMVPLLASLWFSDFKNVTFSYHHQQFSNVMESKHKSSFLRDILDYLRLTEIFNLSNLIWFGSTFSFENTKDILQLHWPFLCDNTMPKGNNIMTENKGC